MTEPTACCAARCPSLNAYCDSCDLLVGLEGLHVIEVERGADRLSVTVESAQEVMGCWSCGVLAVSHGRRPVVLIENYRLRMLLIAGGLTDPRIP